MAFRLGDCSGVFRPSQPAFCLLTAWILLTGLGCGDLSSSDSDLPGTSIVSQNEGAAAFVGAERCAECHSDVFSSWRGSHHDEAIALPTNESVRGQFEGETFQLFDVSWRFVREKEEFVAIERGADGAEKRWPIAFTFGVAPLQQYLVAFPKGRYQVLPVAWDSRSSAEGGQRWFTLFPDEPIAPGDPLHWQGLAFNWNRQCASCHSTALVKGYDVESNAYQTTWAELDVGCEACHGPGSKHLDWAQTPAADPDSLHRGLNHSFETIQPDRWLRPAAQRIATRAQPHDSKAASEVDVCGPCHARREMLVDGPVIGSKFLDGFAPTLLEPGLYFDDGQMLGEVYALGSFLQTPMHASGVVCSDCHDPHSLELRRPGNALCTGCHAPDAFDRPDHRGHAEEGAGSACVDCHMPERIYMGIDGRRDHSFPVPSPRKSEAFGSPSPCETCHQGRGSVWAEAQIADWRGKRPVHEHWSDRLLAARESAAAAHGTPSAPWAAVAMDPAAPPIVRGSAWQRLAAESAGGPALSEVMDRRETGADLERLGLTALGQRLAPGERLALLSPLLDVGARALRVRAADVLANLPAGHWRPADRVRLARGLSEMREAQALNADGPEAWVNLGRLSALEGDAEGARKAYRRALSLAPYFVPAQVNWADLERAEGNEAGAIEHLRAALEWTPEDATIQYALGLAMHRSGQPEEARTQLERAARNGQDQPQLQLGYALALAGANRQNEAIAWLETSIARGVSSPDLEHARALLIRDTGDLARTLSAAREWSQRWPGDERAQALLTALEEALPPQPNRSD